MADSKDDETPDLISWLEGLEADSSPSPAPKKATAKPVEQPSDPAPHRLSIVENTEPGPVEDSADDLGEDDDAEDLDEGNDQPAKAPAVNNWDDLFAASAPAPAEEQEEDAVVAPRRKERKKAAKPAAAPKKQRVKTRREVPGWVKPAVIVTAVVALLALIVGAFMFGGSLGSDYSADHTSPAAASLDASAGQAAATTTRDRSATDMPKDSVTVVSDGCDVKDGQERMPPSQRNLRSAYITFQNEYAARNADGIKALILPENKAWRNQDWDKTLDSLPADYSYCMTMEPAYGNTATATIRMHMNGQDTISNQKITGRADKEGRWFIQKIEAKKD